MIQILTYSGNEDEFNGENTVVNKIHDAQSLDEFEINIINLNDKNIWENSGPGNRSVNIIEDFRSLGQIIERSRKTMIILLLPSNLVYTYSRGERYKHIELKNMIYEMKSDILSKIYEPICISEIVYENTRTYVNTKDISASFYFDGYYFEEIVTQSVGSEKATTVKNGNVILSFLNLNTYDDVKDFLKELGLIKENQVEPEWMEEISMFDDNKQLNIIEQNNEIIRAANEAIGSAMVSINKNKRYKSILYTSGSELVEVVFEILTEMLGCDLSAFEDKKKEDFLFEINNHVFIGEIKGVNHSVKNANVSQLDVHFQTYVDEHPEVGKENVSALLIMAYQRNKPISEREKIHEDQIGLAKRNGSLIVDTMSLLRLFEKYKNGELQREQCIKILKDNTGVIEL